MDSNSPMRTLSSISDSNRFFRGASGLADHGDNLKPLGFQDLGESGGLFVQARTEGDALASGTPSGGRIRRFPEREV